MYFNKKHKKIKCIFILGVDLTFEQFKKYFTLFTSVNTGKYILIPYITKYPNIPNISRTYNKCAQQYLFLASGTYTSGTIPFVKSGVVKVYCKFSDYVKPNPAYSMFCVSNIN